MIGRRQTARNAAPAGGRVLLIGLALGLVVACAEQVADTTGTGESTTATDDPAVVAPPAAADAAPEDLAAQPQAPAGAPMPGGLEAAPEARPDPGLSIEAPSPGQATIRWGDSGRDVDGKSPWRSLAYDGIHERESDAIGVLQEPRSALRSLPRGRSGNFIDWAAALNDGVIQPRARAGGQGRMEVLDLDILLADTKNMPVVTFPHRTHTEWLSCKNCHDWLFKAQRGANDISMTNIARGRDCGLCHGKVAFPPTDCFRCHNGPRPKG